MTNFEERLSYQQSPSIMKASNDDFVIQEQVYQMCPDCPVFSIPIPIPKSTNKPSVQQVDNSRDENLFTKIKGFLSDAQVSFAKFINKDLTDNKVEKRISLVDNSAGTDKSSSGLASMSPLMMAGIAAVTLGVATFMSSGGVSSGRGFAEDEDLVLSNINQVEKIDYNTNDVLCIPRNYCENLKRKKYLIDQFPAVKTIGVNIAEIIWDRDFVSEKGSHTWCNLRECVFSLLR